jgi:hypothetical protein
MHGKDGIGGMVNEKYTRLTVNVNDKVITTGDVVK